MRKKLFVLFLLFNVVCSWAENVSFTASAPDVVEVGQQFRLSYVVTTQDVKDFRSPNIKGFDVLMGPSRSTQSSIQIVNGKQTSSHTITFTFILEALSEGDFTIPSTTIIADGNQMASNAVQIKVLPADKESASQQGNGTTGRSSSGSSVSASDLIITGSVNKTTVYEQEALLLTYKIYTLVDLRSFDNVRLPDFKGFHSQEVELPSERRWGLEHYKGRNYRSTIYRQFILYPQQAGKLTIEPAHFDASIAKAVEISDPFEAFFNGGSSYVEVKKTITTPQQTIEVKPLPGKPADFCGGVGDFSLSSSISSTDVKTNDAVTLRLVISGTGNLKLVSVPEVKFPEEFEVYDPKEENNARLTNVGQTGNKVIEFLAIPRSAGSYKIPAVTMSYFDIKSGQYKTLSSEPFVVNVAKGEGNASQAIANFSNKEDLRVLNEDIRFIKQNKVALQPRGEHLFGSLAYALWYILPLLLFVAAVIYNRKRIAESSNVMMQRGKKANKVAVRRLKQAEKILHSGEKARFYDEVLKALWGYTSDKLSIPVSQLTKDNVQAKLTECNVPAEICQDFLQTLDACEFARFAPSGSEKSAMDKIYADAVMLISKMENIIKR